jgi:nitroreductase
MENKFLDAMMFRHACKEFDEAKKISDEDFKLILQMGRLSPSSFGFEPWQFMVVQNKELREKLKVFTWGAQKSLPTASHFVIILARKTNDMKYGSDYVNRMLGFRQLPSQMEARYKKLYEKFQKSDFNLLESNRAMFDWACKQTYIAMANMMTGAAYMGIDSCPIEGFDSQKAEKFLEKELKIDTELFGISVMTAFGYRKDIQKDKNRLDISDIVYWYN